MQYRTTFRPSTVLVLLITVALVLACEDSSVVTTDIQEETALHDDHPRSAHNPPGGAGINSELSALRRVTAPFHNFDKALEAGYNVPITSCWYHGDLGAMGYHYADPELIANASVNLLEPEAIMYEPGPAGQMRMVGFEYLVPIEPWDENEEDPPSLLGQEYHRNDGLGFYFLHLWLWRNNPEGLFANWNPKVSCEHAEESEDRGTM